MMVIQCSSLYSCPPLFFLFAHLMQFAIHDLSEADGSLITGSILLSFYFLKRTENPIVLSIKNPTRNNNSVSIS